MPDQPVDATPPYDRDAIFDEDSPIHPIFITEAVRTLMRALPLDPDEPPAWSYRRMFSAMLSISALNPRDEIEVMLGVQALCAYHAAAACWRIGMNHHRPNGDSIRHITAAGTAARTCDAMLKALERRQAKPLAIPAGRPPVRSWPAIDPTRYMLDLEQRCRMVAYVSEACTGPDPGPQVVWTAEDLAAAESFLERERIERENEGLDIANTQGILPGGSMILPADPTAEQTAYIGRRLGLTYRREYEANLRNGNREMPKIRPTRPGDLIP